MSTIADMVLLTRPTFDEIDQTDDQVKASVRGHESALRMLGDGSLPLAVASEYCILAEKLHSTLATLHFKNTNLEYAKWICESILEYTSELHRYAK